MNINYIAKKYNIDISKYNISQLVKGYKVELEHYWDPKLRVVKNSGDVLKIVIAHLKELPDYYDRLKKMESKKYLNDAAYPGNIGFVEFFTFWGKATPSEKRLMEKLLEKGDRNGVYKLLEKVTGTKLYK